MYNKNVTSETELKGGNLMRKKLFLNLVLIALFIVIASSAATFEFKMDFND